MLTRYLARSSIAVVQVVRVVYFEPGRTPSRMLRYSVNQLTGLSRIEGGDRQERLFPRIKEISGFLQRYDFSAEHARPAKNVRFVTDQ